MPHDTPAPNNTSLTLDVEAYEHLLADTEWSDAEKIEYLAALWSIITQFVALGYAVRPLQPGERACGKLSNSFADPARAGGDVVELGHPNFDIIRCNDAGDTQKEAP
ncbi:hypothetical protein [Thalassobaculum salexigens]|uniref:hypothetical protein n=1 Tax=Thalassobaculum salexigens TaxID=455360 RepID=UPI0012EC3B76|nr:hypothetical protein [Thalassobaculum salexigens]